MLTMPITENAITNIAIVAGSSIAIAAIARRRTLKQKRGTTRTATANPDGDFRYVRLAKMEEGFLASGMLPPISSATWFQGSIHEASELLRLRVKQIVHANPWLGGRFVKSPDGHYQIQYSVDEASIEQSDANTVHVLSDEGPSFDLSYDEFAGKCLPHLLQPSQDLHQPFWKVVLVPCGDAPDRFLLLMSLSHIVGDGHTKYALYNMLVGGTKVMPLRVERQLSTLEQQARLMGKEEAHVMHSVGIIVGSIRGFILNGMGRLLNRRALKIESRTLLIDADKVAQLKEEAKKTFSGVPFVSTNDIVSSWFLKNCRCEHGFMAVNMRGRIDSHTEDMAGNYQNDIYYRNAVDVENPALIRLSLRNCRRVISKDRPISSSEMAWQNYGLIVNWATFCTEKFDVAGCVMLKHAPIWNSSTATPCTMVMGVLYRAGPSGKLGLLFAGTEDKLTHLSEAPFASHEKAFRP